MVAQPSAWRTRASALSLLRLATAPLLAVAILNGRAEIGALLLALAIATDFADGAVARRFGEVTPLGGLIDHGVDAALCVIGLGALAALGVVPGLLPALVAIAFAQYAVDSRTLAGRPLRASRLGRWNGIAYYVLLTTPVVRDALGLAWPGAGLVRAMAWALVVSTGISMADRLMASRRRA
jgi:phosphatidylglycerophosphate synthase